MHGMREPNTPFCKHASASEITLRFSVPSEQDFFLHSTFASQIGISFCLLKVWAILGARSCVEVFLDCRWSTVQFTISCIRPCELQHNEIENDNSRPFFADQDFFLVNPEIVQRELGSVIDAHILVNLMISFTTLASQWRYVHPRHNSVYQVFL